MISILLFAISLIYVNAQQYNNNNNNYAMNRDSAPMPVVSPMCKDSYGNMNPCKKGLLYRFLISKKN